MGPDDGQIGLKESCSASNLLTTAMGLDEGKIGLQECCSASN